MISSFKTIRDFVSNDIQIFKGVSVRKTRVGFFLLMSFQITTITTHKRHRYMISSQIKSAKIFYYCRKTRYRWVQIFPILISYFTRGD